jgi:hypothetical protein
MPESAESRSMAADQSSGIDRTKLILSDHRNLLTAIRLISQLHPVFPNH